jgi:K+-sensing histidine kinase KdpD
VFERFLRSSIGGYLLPAIGLAVLTGLLILLRGRINATTIGFAFLLLIVFVAIFWGSKPALVASILGVLSYNFFFLPPYRTFTIADPQN